MYEITSLVLGFALILHLRKENKTILSATNLTF